VTELKRFSLIRPTLYTRFHVDFDWWRQNDNDWHIFLSGLLCPVHQEAFAGLQSSRLVDWIDPNTAEVVPVDGIQHLLITHCAKQAGFITPQTTLVDAVFRLFLANGNTPLTPVEMSESLGRPPELILKTLSGGRVYRGMRPCPD